MKQKTHCHDSEYNKKLLSIAEKYSTLLSIQMKSKIQEIKDGAWNIADNSSNPKLKEICKELDKLSLD